MKTTLIITEKPDAAEHVSSALHPKGKPAKLNVNGVPFFEIKLDDRRILVCSALGHLYAVDEKLPTRRSFYPVWDFTWKPKHQVERGQQRQEKWLTSIVQIAKEADEFVNACVAPGTLILTSRGEVSISDFTRGPASINASDPEKDEVLTLRNLSDVPSNYRIARCVQLQPKEWGIDCYELATRSGRRIKATEDHRFMTSRGWRTLQDLRTSEKVAVLPVPHLPAAEVNEATLVTEEQIWDLLRSFEEKQSKAPHSKYRYRPEQYFEAQNLRHEGLTYREIANQTGLGRRTVQHWLGDHRTPYTVRNPAVEQLKNLGLVPLRLNSGKIHAVTRVLGAVFADGCLWQSTTMWYACGVVVTCERSGGADEVLRDLQSLGFKARKRTVVSKGCINNRTFVQRSEEVRCNSLALWLMLRALGAPSGSKTDQAYEIPSWLMTAPKRLGYEFLSTYLGGELTVPTNPQVHPRSFNSPEIRFNKRENLATNGRRFALQLSSLLSSFGVKVTRIDISQSGVQRKDGVRTVSVRIGISNSAESLENLLSRIPVQYCSRKRIVGDLIAEYCRMKKMTGARRIAPYREWARSAKKGLEKSFLIWDTVLEVSKVHCSDVRDLTIEKAHTYVANGFLTHNCDFDIEGSLIGYTILKYACGGADQRAKRMKFSTLTTKDLRESYENMLPRLDFPLAYAGMCRHEVDWLYGVNLSRALTQSAYRASQQYATLSTGRVQGPTLRYVVEREREVSSFVPIPYWTIAARVDVDGVEVEAEFEHERLGRKSEAQKIAAAASGKWGKVENLDSKKFRIRPAVPFDLSALQSEAYRHFGFTPRASLGIAERLYLDAMISYPRTSSQKLPPTVGYENILRGLSERPEYEKNAKLLLEQGGLKPNEGRKEDPAHPAIYPTGNGANRKLEAREQKVYDLIVKRFMASFCGTALKQSEKATIEVASHRFFLRGSRILDKGWIGFYEPYAKFEEIMLPPLTVGQEVRFAVVRSEEKFSQPPPRFNPSSLLKLMEEVGIGTKATRADIIDTLYRRGYITDERIVATPLAFQVIDVLSQHCPRVVDVKFTHELEEMMDRIERGEEEREHVVMETVKNLRPIVEELKLREQEIGRELSKTIKAMRIAERTFKTPCPQCGATIQVIRSLRTKKRFIGCSGYFQKQQCRFSLPLPQMGDLTLLDKRCPECGFQMIQVRIRGRRPMISCPQCFVNRPKRETTTAEALSKISPHGS